MGSNCATANQSVIIKERGRKHVLSLMTEGWIVDHISNVPDGCSWLLHHERSQKRAEVLVSWSLGQQTKAKGIKPVCGYIAINGVIKTTIPL